MKNILLYTDTPQIGGAEGQILLLAKFLNKEKFTPILACSNYEALDKWCKKFKKEEIKVIRIKVKHKHDPRHYFQLKKIIKDEKIDILHAHVWNPASCRYAFSAAKSSKIPIITTEHDPFKLSPIKNIFKKRTLKNITKIITVSKNNKKILKELYPEHTNKIEVIHNGIDTTWWQSQVLGFTNEDRKRIKEEVFHAKKDTLILTTIAELHERKGIKYLIHAMPEIIEKYPNTKLVLIGNGPDREKLERIVRKLDIKAHVTFLGKMNNVPELLKSSNIFVLPSKREAFGLVNAEAMITPLPVVATRVGGIPEIIKDGETGILVKPENPESLAKAILKLMESSELREKMANAGHNRIIKNFDAKKMAENYQKTYKEI